MKAIVYRRYGGPEVLELTELPEPKTHVDSVLIRVKAAGLNRADAAIQAGALDSAVETYFPVVPGWDIAGVVERSGPGAPASSAPPHRGTTTTCASSARKSSRRARD